MSEIQTGILWISDLSSSLPGSERSAAIGDMGRKKTN